MTRWSKRIDALVREVAGSCRPALQRDLGIWMHASPRFEAFVTANHDKVRKKLSTTSGEEARLDIRAELLVAHLILADRRFELTFEAYGARQAAPDLTAMYRTNERFNIDVTRLRSRNENDTAFARLTNTIAGKLRQLPPGIPNVLVIVTRDLPNAAAQLGAAARPLRGRVEGRLSGVFILDEHAYGPEPPTYLAAPGARHPMSVEALRRIERCLAAGQLAANEPG